MNSSQPARAASIDVPVIDISRYFGGGLTDKRAVAREIDAACRSIGFLVITGHGVPEALVEETHRQVRRMFDLPVAEKLKYGSTGNGAYRGYRAMEHSVLAYSRGDKDAAPDYREIYNLNRMEVDPADPYYAGEEGRHHATPNVWPTAVPEFQPVVTEYYKAMEGLSLSLMRLFALGLGLDEHWFDDKVDKHISNFSLSNYPDQDREPRPNQLRAGAHSDWGSLTILKTEDKPGGLEVFTSDGEWRPVPIIPGTFIINIGDLMAQWTNDRWVSTLHRVVNPPRDKATGSRRQSLVFFHQPNHDALIECIPTCAGGAAPKYEPMTSGEYLRMRIEQTYGVKVPA
jgi:isopenicillin N synthase-like dioxygenase